MRLVRATALAGLACALLCLPAARADERRALRVEDVFALKNVGDPRISPDGEWLAYTVASMDAKADRWETSIWMSPLAGGGPVRLTRSEEGERSPRWSPDGRYLAFLSARQGRKTQVWLLDRRGGEAVRLTDYRTDVSDLVWCPDGRRLALVVRDIDPDDPELEEGPKAADGRPRPIVIRRLQFKQDGVGYLDERREHIHVFDVAAKTSRQVTDGPYDDRSPVWSPDGEWLAFVSNRTPEPDSNFNTDVFVVRARGGEAPRNVTASPEAESSPVFSPDGTRLAFVRGGTPEEYWYATRRIAVSPLAGGPSHDLTPDLDRNVSSPRWSADGTAVLFLLEDRGSTHLASVGAAGGAVERVVAGERDIDAFDVGLNGELAVLESQPHHPPEISSVGPGGALSRVTRANDEFLRGIALGPVERFDATAPDGTVIDAFLTRPPQQPAGKRLPAVLWIHGGPVAQFSNRFNPAWQLFASHGYVVVAANPRGSSGRGRDFSHAVWADWGGLDSGDVLAAIDEAVARGAADPDRLGIGGWSYGGILTNWVIAKTDRFRAAVSGSSQVNYTASYGHDQYQRHYELEWGLPWRESGLWIRLSPFFQVEHMKTPTLIVCGSDDWNVPVQNSEQLYQALRRLGRDTELVVYPGENHAIRRPSFVKDRYERYLAWYDRYLQPAAPATATR